MKVRHASDDDVLFAECDGCGGSIASTGSDWWHVHTADVIGNDPHEATPAADTVRTVATSIPAGTFSGGTLTLAANGAFSTAQDGVTLAVGDKFILPEGKIKTMVV